MIISKTPFRLSLLGGLTDFKQWSSVHGGICIGGTIDKYCYITIRRLPPYHDFKSRYVYSEIEKVKSNSEIKHKAIRMTLEYLGMENEPIELTHIADIPSRSGVGSSSSFVVGLLNALLALQGRRMCPGELTDAAIHIEQDLLSEAVGCQDQAWAANGGFNIIRFRTSGEIDVTPFALSPQHLTELQSHFLMFFTGIQRNSTDVVSKYIGDIAKNVSQQVAITRLTNDGIDCIYTKNWERLGKLIDQSWRIKASYANEVSSEEINNLYLTARENGAFGGKISGAGGGGMMLLCVPPNKQERVIQAMAECGASHIPFNFSHSGSTIIYQDRN